MKTSNSYVFDIEINASPISVTFCDTITVQPQMQTGTHLPWQRVNPYNTNKQQGRFEASFPISAFTQDNNQPTRGAVPLMITQSLP